VTFNEVMRNISAAWIFGFTSLTEINYTHICKAEIRVHLTHSVSINAET